MLTNPSTSPFLTTGKQINRWRIVGVDPTGKRIRHRMRRSSRSCGWRIASNQLRLQAAITGAASGDACRQFGKTNPPRPRLASTEVNP